MVETINTPFSFAPWKIESLRVTGMLTHADLVDGQVWWHEITGEDPQNKIERLKEGLKQYFGVFAEGQLNLNLYPFKADWLFSSQLNPFSSGFPSFNESTENLTKFIDLMNKWLSISPDLHRLAFGITAMLPCKDLEECHEIMPRYFPLNSFNFENSRDFSYTINRPRDSISRIPNLKINRISVWSLFMSTKLDVLNPINLGLNSPPINFDIRLEVDINTSQEFKEFLPANKKPELFKELIDLAHEIILRGDIQ